jgi:acetyl-CoA synthase
MSKIIATVAIQGAYETVKQAEQILSQAIQLKGENCRVEFPNTGYYIPIIYSMTGTAVEKLGDFQDVMQQIKALLPPPVSEDLSLPYFAPALDAGMATLFAEEIIEACKYLIGPSPVDDLWLGAADDVILRERGIQFVDGSAPGFAAVIGAAPDVKTAVSIARKLQQRSLYVFMCGHSNRTTFAEQLVQGGVQLGWETRLVPFGREITSVIYALGFASRAALSFGAVAPGDFRRNLLYNKNRIFAFVMAMGQVTAQWAANAAGAMNYGFPTITDANLPQILPSGVCTYEHFVSNIPCEQIVEKAIEVRGLKIKISEIPIPVAVSPAFEGERIRKEQMHCEFGGQKSPAFEWLRMRDIADIEDGKVLLHGPDIDTLQPGQALPLGIVIEVAGRKFQPDFEPVLERYVHTFINEAQGIWHMGQRDTCWVRISLDAFKAGFRLEHIGKLLHAKYHEQFSSIVDKVQVLLYTDAKQVAGLRKQAQAVYTERDTRLAGMQDEDVEIFYSCTLCQSFAPNHICIVSPERPGLCGAYSWLDCRASYEITPTGPNQPITKGNCLDMTIGQWEKINAFVLRGSGGHVERMSQYSMIIDPMTSCGCFECIAAVLPSTGGIMLVNREFTGMTPSGMKFSSLAGSVGGGQQTPGFIGHSKQFIGSKKFIAAEGGIIRIVWMPSGLKKEMQDVLIKKAEEMDLGGAKFLDMIADETTASTEEEVLAFTTAAGHPVLTLQPMF